MKNIIARLFLVLSLLSIVLLSGCASTLPVMTYQPKVNPVNEEQTKMLEFHVSGGNVIIERLYYENEHGDRIDILTKDYNVPSGKRFFIEVPFGMIYTTWIYETVNSRYIRGEGMVMVSDQLWYVVYGPPRTDNVYGRRGKPTFYKY